MHTSAVNINLPFLGLSQSSEPCILRKKGYYAHDVVHDAFVRICTSTTRFPSALSVASCADQEESSSFVTDSSSPRHAPILLD